MSSAPIFDRAGVMMRLENDEELFKELLEVFHEEHPVIMAEIEKCAAAKDKAGLALKAHSLKGALGNVGAVRAAEAARVIEFAAKAGDLSNVGTLVPELKAQVVAFVEAVKS